MTLNSSLSLTDLLDLTDKDSSNWEISSDEQEEEEEEEGSSSEDEGVLKQQASIANRFAKLNSSELYDS